MHEASENLALDPQGRLRSLTDTAQLRMHGWETTADVVTIKHLPHINILNSGCILAGNRVW